MKLIPQLVLFALLLAASLHAAPVQHEYVDQALNSTEEARLAALNLIFLELTLEKEGSPALQGYLTIDAEPRLALIKTLLRYVYVNKLPAERTRPQYGALLNLMVGALARLGEAQETLATVDQAGLDAVHEGKSGLAQFITDVQFRLMDGITPPTRATRCLRWLLAPVVGPFPPDQEN